MAEIQSINTGAVQAPYQEFIYDIAPGSNLLVNYVTNNFVLLETSAPEALEVNFGGAVNQTNFTTGVQYKLEQIVPNVRLFNKSKSTLMVHFALGVGDIRDNRLSVVGTIQATETYAHFKTKRINLANSGTRILTAGLKAVVQNVGAVPVYVGDASGFLISPSGSIDLPISSSFDLYGRGGQVVVGIFASTPIADIDYEIIPGIVINNQEG